MKTVQLSLWITRATIQNWFHPFSPISKSSLRPRKQIAIVEFVSIQLSYGFQGEGGDWRD